MSDWGLPADEQTQGTALRRGLGMTLARWTAVYLAVFLVACTVFELVLKDPVAAWLVETTTVSTVMSEEDLTEFVVESGMPSRYFDFQSVGDGKVVVRDMSVYYRLRAIRWPLVMTVFFAGYAFLVFRLLERSIGYFEELSGAVAGVLRSREKPVWLSPELSIVQDELNEVREAALADEQAAVKAERRKNELVAYLAHDIRTPLTSVLGYLSLMDEAPDLPEEQRRRYVATALAKAEVLDELTAEFFEITRYNLASIPIERVDVDVRLFLEQIVDEFLPEMTSRSIAADVSAPDGETMRVDPEKMARALGNVVRNAIAYADAASTLELVARRREGGEGWAITVSDHGREIAPEHLESIFDRFFRADAARPSQGNAGLGLAIAREIVQAHGGRIYAESEAGVTTFTIELP